MNEQELNELARRVLEALRKEAGWLTYRQLAWRLLGDAELDFLVEAACLLPPWKGVLARHQERRVKLAEGKLPPGGGPPPAVHLSDTPAGAHEFWVFVSDWDVLPTGQGPYRAMIHTYACQYVANWKYEEEGVGYKNYWRSFPTLLAASEFSSSLHPWARCSRCFGVEI